MDFQIRSETIQKRVPVTVLHLSGSLNIGSAEAFDQAGRQAVEHGARYVLLDMKDVPAVRSAGLRSVQLLYNMLNPRDAASATGKEPVQSPYLKAANLAPDVHYVFDVSGFLGNIACYDDMDAALNSFG